MRSKRFAIIGRLAAVAFGLLLFESCLRHGEPDVLLPNEYHIAAPWSSAPCSLVRWSVRNGDESNWAPITRNTESVTDVSGFATDGRLAIMTGDAGSFILDTSTHDLQTFALRADWATAVRAQTKLDPEVLSSPRSFWLQHRPPFMLAILGIAALIGILWALEPLDRRPRTAPTLSSP